MPSKIQSQQPVTFTTCCHCSQEEACGSEGQTVCCQHPCCACKIAFEEEVKLRDVIQIDFLDHVQDATDGPLKCSVYGSLTEIGDNYLTVTSWQGCDEDNTTTFTIITSCISSLVVFKPNVIITIDSPEADDETHCGGQSITPNPVTDTSE